MSPAEEPPADGAPPTRAGNPLLAPLRLAKSVSDKFFYLPPEATTGEPYNGGLNPLARCCALCGSGRWRRAPVSGRREDTHGPAATVTRSRHH